MAVRFDSANDRYTITGTSTAVGLPTDRTWTALCWVYLSADRDNYSPAFCLSDSAGTPNYLSVGFGPNGTVYMVGWEGTDLLANTAPTDATVGQWSRIAAVCDGTNVTLYWGAGTAGALGSRSAAGALTPNTRPTELYIGCDRWFTFGSVLDGRVAGFKLWDAALTASEVAAEFAQFAPVRSADLLRYHRFATANANDDSGLGRSALTVSGSPSTEADPAGVPETAGPVEKSGSDSGAGSETGGVTATVDGTDSGTGTEDGSVVLAGEDSGAGTEDGYVAEGREGSDSGIGAETGTATATVTSGEAGVGGEQGGTLATLAGGDSNLSGVGLYPSDTLYPSESLFPGSQGTAEFGHIEIPGTDTGAGSDQLTSLAATVTSGDAGTGVDGGYVETLFGNLNISFYVIHPDTDALIALPDLEELTLSPIRNSGGSVTLTYPPDGLNFDVLRGALTANRDLEFEVWTSGSAAGALRGYLNEAAGDDVVENNRSWQFGGWFLEGRMSEAWVEPQPIGPLVPDDDDDPTNDQHANEKRELVFSAATPGELVEFIMEQAQDRGVLTDIVWDFTDAADSNGDVWPQVISTKFSPGASYRQIMDRLVSLGLVEWAVVWTGSARLLRLWRPEGRGTDLTVGQRPVVLRHGRNLLDAPRKWSVRDSGTAVLVAGDDALYDEASDPDAETRRGRRIERFVSANNLADPVSVASFAAQQLQVTTTSLYQVDHGIGFVPGEPRPIIAFDVGDWLYSETNAIRERLRVVQWTLTVSRDQSPSGTVTLNDTVQDAVVRLQARLDALTAGETVVGTSEPSQPQDTGIPMAPDGVVVGSDTDVIDGTPQATVTVGWLPVEFNVDGTAATDINGYRAQYRYVAQPDVWIGAGEVGAQQQSLSFVATPETEIGTRVAAYDRNGNMSEWSEVINHTTAAYLEDPPVPSTPEASNFLGSGRIRWDGNTADGTLMQLAAPAFRRTQVHLSTASLFTPTAATQIGTLGAYGTISALDLDYDVEYFVRLVAEDVRGNVSAPSAQASFVPRKLVDLDFGPDSVDRAAIKSAAIGSAEIDLLAVNDGHVANLGVGKLVSGMVTADMILSTGEIRSGDDPNNYTVQDTAGLRMVFNGQTRIEFNRITGSALITGTIQTGLTGRRLYLDAAAGEMRLYPTSGTNYNLLYNAGSSGLIFRSGVDGNNRAGFLYLQSSSAQISYGTPGTLVQNSRLQCSINATEMWAPILGFRIDHNFTPTDGTSRRAFFSNFSSGVDDPDTVLWYQDNGNAEPWWFAPGKNVALTFAGTGVGNGSLFVSSGQGNPSAISASAFNVTSTIDVKENVGDARRDLDPLATIRNARAKSWNYTFETVYYPPITEEEPNPEPIPVENPPLRFGPVAEELPGVLVEEVPGPDGIRVPGVNLASQIGVMWAAIGQLLDQKTLSVTGRALAPAGTYLAGDRVTVQVAWDETPLEVPSDVDAVPLASMPTAMGKVRARYVPGSVTLTGCSVELLFSGTGAVVVNNSLPITVEVIGRYIYTPPFVQKQP